MTTARTRQSNKGRSLKFRELVQLVLAADGIKLERKAEVHDGMAGAGRERADLQGSRWAIMTRNEAAYRDISGGLDDAVAAALHDRKDRAACVWHRPGRDASESYVVMTLSSFARVLREEAART